MHQNYYEKDDAKPLMYLDQNVIDWFRKMPLSTEEEFLLERYKIVYSDETLREIARAEGGGGAADTYLDVLERLQAYHLCLLFDEFFEPTGEALVREASPKHVYAELTNHNDFNEIIEANTLITRKFMGGLSELTADEVIAKMRSAFLNLLKQSKACTDLLKSSHPRTFAKLNSSFYKNRGIEEITAEVYESYLPIIREQLLFVSSEESGLNRFRNSLRLNPVRLNNLEPPNIVEQVWEVIVSNNSIANSDIGINEYFGVNSRHPIYTHRNYNDLELATNVYFQLNLAGYYSDPKLHKHREYMSSNSDMQHVAMATHCDFLLSNDNRLLMKAAATYDFLNIPTDVVHFNQ